MLPTIRPIAVPHWRMTRARVPCCLLETALPADSDGFALVDIDIDRDRVAAIVAAPSPERDRIPSVDLAGQIVLPCFVDAHVHLDKGHIWPRLANPTGDLSGAIGAAAADRAANWTAADVGARMQFSLRCAYAHGTLAMRTHIDSIGRQIDVSWPVFARLRDQWRGKIDLTAVPLFPVDLALDTAHMSHITRTVATFGSTLGAVAYPMPALWEGLDRLFRIASDRGFDLDFHVDETQDVAANCLRVIAETALKFRFRGRILAGHCCSLALQEKDEASRTIGLVAEAKISVVSLPMCNSYLLDRATGRTPRWRGVTALHELRAAGVNVVLASDNTRDPFYAYGDLDMLEVLREGTRILHLDRPFVDWPRAVTRNAAAAIGRDHLGKLTEGCGADLIVFPARNLSELLARPHGDRTVIRGGRVTYAVPPDYSDLDP
jgi:cytosine deaminase